VQHATRAIFFPDGEVDRRVVLFLQKLDIFLYFGGCFWYDESSLMLRAARMRWAFCPSFTTRRATTKQQVNCEVPLAKFIPFLSLLVLVGCPVPGDKCIDSGSYDVSCIDLGDKPTAGNTDYDADGYFADVDCDDADATVNPDATEVCNGYDDDCDGDVDIDATDGTVVYTDADGDGYGAGDSVGVLCDDAGYANEPGDCDDANVAVNPDAVEACDGIDSNCDGNVDDDLVGTWYADADGDGYGDVAVSSVSCEQPAGYVLYSTDCNDANAFVYPGATEVCNGVDDDCEGTVDEGAVDASPWYVDNDSDGYGDSSASILACERVAGYAATADDCDDTDARFNPGAVESDCADPTDYNCDGSTGYTDSDGDGYVACEECDDGSAAVYPGATEVCNGVDDDCKEAVDVGAVDAPTWYADVDVDGFGDVAVSAVSCSSPLGYVADATDCDDTSALSFPGNTEVCDNLDNNCDGNVDSDAVDIGTWYADVDSDGFGDVSVVEVSCSASTGYVADATDCDDADSAVNPSATEVCNGTDDNCDGNVDSDAVDVSAWYEDVDQDGFGDGAEIVYSCEQPEGYTQESGDCDDGDSAYSPGAVESDCTDPNDYNCDGSSGATDTDGDGYFACEECNDRDASVSPGAVEVCNEVDDDCNGATDEGLDVSYYTDSDGDGYGDPATEILACAPEPDQVGDNTDCNDANAFVYPGATEVCNGVDDDCSGGEDDGLPWTSSYVDADGDSFGDPAVVTSTCDGTIPAGSVAAPGDCDDANAGVNPAAAESCNGMDDNCDAEIDEGLNVTYYADDDGDSYGDPAVTAETCAWYGVPGYVTDNTDCDDSDAGSSPGESEVCDGSDNNCDGQVDEGVSGDTYYFDADGDGYGDPAVTETSCVGPSADHVADSTDCDDSDAGVNPGEVENPWLAADVNCDGLEGHVGVTYGAGGVSEGSSDVGAVTFVGGNVLSGTDVDFAAGYGNWEVYYSYSGYDTLGLYTHSFYGTAAPISGVALYGMDVLVPSSRISASNECLSVPLTVTSGVDYGFTVIVQNSGSVANTINIGLDSRLSWFESESIAANAQELVVGGFTATASTHELVLCTGLWEGSGLISGLYVGEASF
jgi:large repetitive protein